MSVRAFGGARQRAAVLSWEAAGRRAHLALAEKRLLRMSILQLQGLLEAQGPISGVTHLTEIHCDENLLRHCGDDVRRHRSLARRKLWPLKPVRNLCSLRARCDARHRARLLASACRQAQPDLRDREQAGRSGNLGTEAVVGAEPDGERSW